MNNFDPLHSETYTEMIQRALEEDLSTKGDITSIALVDETMQATASMIAKESGVVAGLNIAEETFQIVDPTLKITLHVADGAAVEANQKLLTVEGSAQNILTAERVALNMLSHLSGVATATNTMVQLIKNTKAKILCTRKTTPGLRLLEKYAVRAGGGMNHRFGLYDAVMIKDNHLALYDSINDAVNKVKEQVSSHIKITVEVDTLDQLQKLLETPVDVVLLDNMTPEQTAEAVKIVDGKMRCEVSGGMTPKNVQTYAETGVDYISSGWVTHSAKNLDISLDLDLKR